MSDNDLSLLKHFTTSGDDRSFETLVARYTDLVYSAALRQTGSDDIARDLTQDIFASLAKDATRLSDRLRPGSSLAGWLYQATRFAALNHLRSERRRTTREKLAMETQQLNEPPEDAWANLAPTLDSAMEALAPADREALLLRFFQERDLESVGKALGVGADAAQKRVSRALDRLREILSSRGVKTGHGLASLLTAHAVQTAPPGLVASISHSVVTGGIAAVHTASGTSLTLSSVIKLSTPILAAMTAAKFASITAVALLGIALSVQTWRLSQSAREVDSLTQQLNGAQEASREATLAHEESMKAARLRLNTVDAPATDALSLAQFQAAIQDALQLPLSRRPQALRDLAARLDPAELPRAVAVLESSPNTFVRTQLRNALLQRWAKADPKAAMVAADSSANTSLRSEARRTVIGVWATLDLESALAWNQTLPGGLETYRIRETLILSATGVDPKRGAELTSTLLQGRRQVETTAQVAELWARTDPKGAAEWLRGLPEGYRRVTAIRRCLTTLTQGDPSAAIGLAREQPSGEEREALMTQVMSAWAGEDLPAARAILNQETDPHDRASLARGLVTQLAEHNPTEAIAIAESFPRGKERDQLLGNAVAGWSDRDPKSAMTWAQHLPDPNLRQQLFEAIAEQWGLNAPAEAAQFITSELSDHPDQPRLLRSIVGRWAETDPVSASNVAMQLEEGDQRLLAFQELSDNWGVHDPEAAAHWLLQQSIGPSRDAGLVTLARSRFDHDPETALQLALEISNPGARTEQVRERIRRWREQQPEAAERWLASTPLPPELLPRTELRKAP